VDLDKDVVVGALAALGGCLVITIIAFIGVFIWHAKRTTKRIHALEQSLQVAQPVQKPVGTEYGNISGIDESDFASTRYENSDVLLGART
jgi:hypothetical protein